MASSVGIMPVPTVVARRPSTEIRITVDGAAGAGGWSAANAGGAGTWVQATSSRLARMMLMMRMDQ